jgi:hypothetical protein
MTSSAPKDNIFKHAIIAFALALLGYIFFFSCDAHLRTTKGPWIVEFTTTNNDPLLVINQPALHIENVRIQLVGEKTTNAPATVRFDKPFGIQLPYGRVRFHDLTYLPGTITLDLFGHEIEMIPRALFINTNEVAWSNNSLFVLTAKEKNPALKDRDRKGRR